MRLTTYIKISVLFTCIVLVIITVFYFYGGSIKDRSIWLTFKPLFAWFICLCYFTFLVAVPHSKVLSLFMLLTFFAYGLADIIIELGDAMLAAGAIGFLIGHVLYNVGVGLGRKTESESDVPKQGTMKIRHILCAVFVLVYIGITTAAIVVINTYSSDISLTVISIVYPLSFAIMSVLAVYCWHRASSIALNTIGALIYAASDLVTAMQALMGNQPWMHYFIMPSYWIALLIIAAAPLPVIYHAADYDGGHECEDDSLEVLDENYQQAVIVDVY